MKNLSFGKKLSLFAIFPIIMLIITIIMNLHFVSTYQHSNRTTTLSNTLDLYVENEKIKSNVALPSAVYYENDDDTIFLKGNAPATERNELYITALVKDAAIEILLDGNLRYSLNPSKDLKTNSNLLSGKLVRLKLSPDEFGMPLEIRIKPTDGFNNFYHLPAFYYGVGEGVQHFSGRDVITILFNFSIFISIILSIFCYCYLLLKDGKKQEAINYFYFVFFYLNIFLLFTVFSSKSIYNFIPYPYMVGQIILLLSAFLPFSFFACLSRLYKRQLPQKLINVAKLTIWPLLSLYFISFTFGLDSFNKFILILFTLSYLVITLIISISVIKLENIPLYFKHSILFVTLALFLNIFEYYYPNLSGFTLLTIKQSIPSIIGILLVIYSISSYFKKNSILIKKNVLKDLAFKDSLSGCYNRQAYEHRLSQNLNQKYYYIMIDINNMKTINDSFGHEKGDEAIKLLGTVIIPMLDKDSACYRIGGDEFAIIAKADAISNINSFIHDISLNYHTKSDSRFTLSIGYSVIEGNNEKKISDAIASADYKMYIEKQKFHSGESKV